MKNILYQFIKGQAHFGMSRNVKMSLALGEPHKIGCYPFKFKQYLQACTTRKHIVNIVSKTTNIKPEGPTRDKIVH